MTRTRLLAGIFLIGVAQTFAQSSAPPKLGTQFVKSPTPAPKSSPAKTEKKAKPAKKEAVAGATPDAADAPITTQIYADEARFDSSKYIGVFTGHVVVNDPRFNVQSDKLTIYITKGQNEGLEKAIAEGNVGVVRDRPDENGGPPVRAVGRAEKAIYTTKDGNVELSGTPRVQQGVNTHIATAPETVMIISEGGQLQTHGPSRTEIRQEPSPTPTPAAAVPAPAPSASTSPTPARKP